MSENEIAKLLKQINKKIDNLENQLKNQKTTTDVLTVKAFTERYGWTASTQAKYRTSKKVPENLPYTKAGGITYVTKEIDEWMERHKLRAKPS